MTAIVASTNNILTKQVPTQLNVGYLNGTPNPYVRPSDWLTLPTVTTSDQKFIGLFPVYDCTTNYCSFKGTTSAGSYLINWGDGTSETVSSTVQANHTYTYSSISAGTLSTRGYKQVIVTVTAISGNLTGAELQVKHPSIISTTYNTAWLDAIFVGEYLTNITVSSYQSTDSPNLLEQVRFVNLARFSDWVGKMNNCTCLQKFIYDSPTSFISSGSFSLQYMFSGCTMLRFAPEITLPDPNTVISITGAFSSCTSLEYVPDYNFYFNNASSAFSSCTSLTRGPKLKHKDSFGNDCSIASIFSGCSSLQYVPDMEVSLTSSIRRLNAATAFGNCTALKQAPFIDMRQCNDASNMFSGCNTLEYVPSYSFDVCTTTQGMFQNCYQLKYVPKMYTPLVTSMASMFGNCYSLRSIGQLNFNSVTSTTSMFSGCYSIIEFSIEFNMPVVTITQAMFINCRSLEVPPVITTSNLLVTTTQMFNSCQVLNEVPNFNVSGVTNATSMFSGCYDLKIVPSYNFSSSLINTSNMFNSSGIVSIPSFTTSGVTNMSTMFTNCKFLNVVPNLTYSTATTHAQIFSATSIGEVPSSVNLNGAVATAMSTVGGNYILRKYEPINIRTQTILTNNLLGKTELQNTFNNLIGSTTSFGITITNNPGADTAIATTGTYATNNNTMTVASATGLSIGMFAYGVSAGVVTNWTFSSVNDTITTTGGTVSNGTRISFSALIAGTGLVLNTIYYVVNSSGTSFQIALTPGGSPVDITGPTPAGSIRYEYYITNIAGTTLTMNAPASVAGTSIAVSFRTLNTHIARLKNWTVTG